MNDTTASGASSTEARLRLAAIVDSTDDAIVGKDLSGIVTAWNRAAETMFGYGAAEIIGRPITLVVPPERLSEEATILAMVGRGERIGHLETERLRKDGGRVPVSLTISPIRDSTGLIVGVSTIARDLTERRAQEQRFATLQAELAHVARINELGQMASTLAHELSQPLAAMANYRSALRQLLGSGRTEEARAVVERIAEQADRAHLLVARLRALIRKGEVVRKPESLRECIEEAAALALVGLGGSVALEIRIGSDAAVAEFDRIQVQQVLLNLLRNAAEAMQGSSRRELSVATARAHGMVEIRVTDTGPGLAEGVRRRLFQPFVTTKRTGLGIGLSVCQTIVEAHGGELSAADAPGGGTIFSFTLPVGSGGVERPVENDPDPTPRGG